jgi:hypothetical protein
MGAAAVPPFSFSRLAISRPGPTNELGHLFHGSLEARGVSPAVVIRQRKEPMHLRHCLVGESLPCRALPERLQLLGSGTLQLR